MDHIWSPWRYKFLVSAPVAKDECVLCQIQRDPARDEQNFVVFRAIRNFVVLNLYPYTSGHLMIVPNEHVKTLNESALETTGELMQLTRAAEQALTEVYHPDGINLGMNLGSAAGAGIAGHIHMHVLPRWYGDANFMSTIGETRVLPEELAVTWRRLRTKFVEITPTS